MTTHGDSDKGNRRFPRASSGNARIRMQGQAQRDTGPEVELRRELRRRGIRGYRLDWRLPFDKRRRADIVWPVRKVAVFVDGCFWHGCPVHFTLPKSNTKWWQAKIAANIARDRDTDTRLREAGWKVLRLWEHIDTAQAADTVETLLADRR